MPEVSRLGRLVIRSSAPILKAITLLAPDFGVINRKWRRKLQRLSASREEFSALAGMNPQHVLEDFRKSDFAGFRRTMIAQGEELASKEVALERAIAASREFLNLCLRALPRRDAATRAMALSLVRLTSVGQLFIISGFTTSRTAHLQRLEHDLAGADERLQSLSRIITDVYDQERRSISRDLHDEIGHDLIVLKLYLEMISRDILQGRGGKVPGKLEEAIALVSKAIDRVRQLSFDLGPAISNELGFASALKLYVRQFAKRTGIRVQLRTSGFSSPLPSTHEMTLYRILQGALSNVGQHSKATHARIVIARKRDSVAMTIEDNGAGFDTKRALGPDRAFGILTMRERVELLRGEFGIESKPAKRARNEHGTRISVQIPVFAAPRQVTGPE